MVMVIVRLLLEIISCRRQAVVVVRLTAVD
jgi:hypothetical protein